MIRLIDRRNSNAMNVEGFRGYIFHADETMKFPYKDEEFIRMWVADMEFATPDCVLDGMRRGIDRRIFGYTRVFDPEYYRGFNGWCQRRYGRTFPKNELVMSNGIITALFEMVDYITKPGEKVLFLTPSYAYFKYAAEYHSREFVCSDLVNNDSYYTVDFADLEKKCADPATTLFILCNTHIPMGKIMPEYERLVTCMAPTKTFNFAGMMISNIIIRSENLKATWKARHYDFDNPISIVAAQSAYEEGEDWLEALRAYLDENFRFTGEYLAQNLPKAKYRVSEATYLAWVDLNAYFEPDENLPMFFAYKAGVLLDGGNMFVQHSDGFIRLNLACPKSVLAEGLKRICEAVNTKHTGKYTGE